jgi:hypothetical protein
MRFGLLVLAALVLDWITRTRLPAGAARRIGLALAVAATAVLVALASPRPPRLHDFDKAYYRAGSAVLYGTPELYGSEGVQGFVNIPVVAWLFAPFAALPPRFARLLFTTLGLWVVVAAYRGMLRLTGAAGGRAALIGLLFAINGPLMYSIQIGNTTHHVLWLLVVAAGAIVAGRDTRAGWLVGIAALLKLPLMLLGGYLAAERRTRAIAAVAATLAIALVLSLALFGVREHQQWYREVVEPFSSRPMVAYNVQSVDGALARLTTAANVGEWLPVEVGKGFRIVRAAVLILLIGTTAWVVLGSPRAVAAEALLLDMSIVLCLAIVTSPIAWTHYYLLLLLPLGLYAGGKLPVPQTSSWRALVAISVLLISPPVRPVLIVKYLDTGLLPRAVISHYLAGGLLLLGVMLAARVRNQKQGTRD